jgi:hypothetical protein
MIDIVEEHAEEDEHQDTAYCQILDMTDLTLVIDRAG